MLGPSGERTGSIREYWEALMSRMLEAGALAGDATRTHDRETAEIVDFGQRVGLIEDGGKTVAAEEFGNGGNDRPGVD
jgi:hypothetical protein